MTVSFNVMIASVFAQANLYAESHSAYCTSEVVRGRSKTIPAFTFSTHHGREALLTFPCTGEY